METFIVLATILAILYIIVSKSSISQEEHTAGTASNNENPQNLLNLKPVSRYKVKRLRRT